MLNKRKLIQLPSSKRSTLNLRIYALEAPPWRNQKRHHGSAIVFKNIFFNKSESLILIEMLHFCDFFSEFEMILRSKLNYNLQEELLFACKNSLKLI